MSDFLTEINAIMASMQAETSSIVKIWMNWMGLVFLASVFFIWTHKPARFVFAAMVATMAAVMQIWSLTKNVHLFGVAHILIWLPLALYLWFDVLRKKARQSYEDNKRFLIWIALLFVTIVISLIFDVRDIYLVMIGAK